MTAIHLQRMRGQGTMSSEHYYHSFLNRDRLVHIADADAGTCEALSVLFRLEGFQTTFSTEAAHFISMLDRRRPETSPGCERCAILPRRRRPSSRGSITRMFPRSIRRQARRCSPPLLLRLPTRRIGKRTLG